MKKTALFIVISILIMSCNKDNTGNRQVVIKGKIPFAGSVKGQMVKAGGSLSLNDAKKILVFDGLDLEGTLLSTSFVDIIDGSFSAGAKLGNAAALVFLDADNKYIGTLSTRGLMLLPLGNLSDGENTTIDLSSLTLSGTSVLPSYDPFGKEIIISDSELKILKEMDGFFESLAKNIDADNDGIPDILNDKQVYIRTQYEVSAGRYGVNTTPSSISTTALNNINYTFFVFGGKGFIPKSISLSGPLGAPHTDIVRQFFTTELHGCGFGSGFWRQSFSGGVNSLLPFSSGTYSITLDDKAYTLNYSLVDLRYNLLFVLPTLHTNSEGMLVSITIEYRLPDNSILPNPENILKGVGIQLTGESLNYDTPHLSNLPAKQLGSNAVHGLYSYTLPAPLDISKLHHVSIAYSDILGNMYMLLFRNDI